MTTKAELQQQITDLQNEFSEKIADLWNKSNYVKENEPQKYWYLSVPGEYIIGTNSETLFGISHQLVDDDDEPHGLGRYKTKEYAEIIRAGLIGFLQEAKEQENCTSSDFDDDSYFVEKGKRIIKKLEDGTYA